MLNDFDRQALESELIERAWNDDAFLAELRADPGAVISRELAARGIALNEGVQVYLHEETPTAVHLVLPVNMEREDVELDDEALDLVSGGFFKSQDEKKQGPSLCCDT